MEKNKIFFMKFVTDYISQGGVFKDVFSWFLKILAVGVVFKFIQFSIDMWGFASKAPGKVIFTLIVIQLLMIVICYMLVHLFIIRANDVSNMPADSDYAVFPIIAVSVKLIGEAGAILIASFNITAGIAIWFGGKLVKMIVQKIGFFMGGSSGNLFVAGLETIIVGVLAGYIILVFMYFLAEQISVFFDIARNTKRS